MRTVGAVVVALALGGCGLRYTGTQEQMQQVARGAAELMKKDPYSEKTSGAGAAAHMLMDATMGQKKEADERVDWQGAGWQCQGSCFAEFIPPRQPPKPLYGGSND